MNRMKFPSFPRLLLVIFLVTLPFVNPWVRGDGVNYYAYVRSLLVQHNLSFEADWRHANLSFRMWSVNPEGQIAPEFYTSTGHVKNDYAVGAPMLWAPFLVPVHAGMLVLQRLGFNVKADGFSKPYVLTMALATALYAFVGLWLSFRFTCSYVPERWAFLATLGMWFASSLPIYMYFIPSYSHAHSVFAAALFLWYWNRTRPQRSVVQWVILGLLSGLLLDIYYLNIAILLLPLLESLQGYWRSWRTPGHHGEGARQTFPCEYRVRGRDLGRLLADADHAHDHQWPSPGSGIRQPRLFPLDSSGALAAARFVRPWVDHLDAHCHPGHCGLGASPQVRQGPGGLFARGDCGLVLHRGLP